MNKRIRATCGINHSHGKQLLATLTLAILATIWPLSQARANLNATYIFSGTASGTIGTLMFNNSILTLTAKGNTAELLWGNNPDYSTYCYIPIWAGNATVSIAGIVNATLTEYISIFDNQGTGGLGLIRYSPTGDFWDFQNSVFSTYDLTSSIGPINQQRNSNVSMWLNMPTSIGNLTVTNDINTTFQAIVVPEPATLLLLGLGGMALRNRKS